MRFLTSSFLIFLLLRFGAGQEMVKSVRAHQIDKRSDSWEEETLISNEIQSHHSAEMKDDYSSDNVDKFPNSDDDQFNETLLLKEWNATPSSLVPRICLDSRMMVAVPKNSVGSNAIFLSCCHHQYMQVNSTHVIFDLPYSAFTESTNHTKRQCGCKDLRIIRYKVGLAYVFELSTFAFTQDSIEHAKNSVAYCFFPEPQDTDHHVGARLQFYSLYDLHPLTSTLKRVGSNEHILFEIVPDEDLPKVDNVPINCWLSPHAKFAESIQDMADTVFLQNGCPMRHDVDFILPSQTGLPRKAKDGVLRILFTIGTHITSQFQYVHCQYVKCSNDTDAATPVGWPPRCPWLHACAYEIPLPYNESQYEAISSDIVFITVKDQPQGIHITAASHHELDRSCNCKSVTHPVADAPNEDASMVKISQPMLTLISFGTFFVGFILAGGLCYFERRRLKNELRQYETRSGKMDGTDLALLARPKGASFHQPDVLAQTPSSKRSFGVHAPIHTRRERHLAGHNGHAPERPASSYHATPSLIVGGSTIIRNDEQWMAKQEIGDSVD